jgi:hypothetical protein
MTRQAPDGLVYRRIFSRWNLPDPVDIKSTSVLALLAALDGSLYSYRGSAS